MFRHNSATDARFARYLKHYFRRTGYDIQCGCLLRRLAGSPRTDQIERQRQQPTHLSEATAAITKALRLHDDSMRRHMGPFGRGYLSPGPLFDRSILNSPCQNPVPINSRSSDQAVLLVNLRHDRSRARHPHEPPGRGRTPTQVAGPRRASLAATKLAGTPRWRRARGRQAARPARRVECESKVIARCLQVG